VFDSGAYLVNYKGCSDCGQRDWPSVTDNVHTDEHDEETIEFMHSCKYCGHEIARHFWSFSVVENKMQEYLMECGLCGKGASSVRIHAPRQQQVVEGGGHEEEEEEEGVRRVVEVSTSLLAARVERFCDQQLEQEAVVDEDWE
jgi:hypothetical protein